jgi:hypothetical protein
MEMQLYFDVTSIKAIFDQLRLRGVDVLRARDVAKASDPGAGRMSCNTCCTGSVSRAANCWMNIATFTRRLTLLGSPCSMITPGLA